MDYGYVIKLQAGFEEAIAAVRAALEAEGFGVLTEIDVREAFRKKLDIDFRPYRILGACNPVLAHKALTAEPGVGLLLPCNVVVEESGNGVTISIANPRVMSELVDNPKIDAVVEEANRRLQRVITALS